MVAGVQTKHAYQKQPTIFQNKKRILLGGTGKEKLLGYYRNIGLGFMVPKEALRAPILARNAPILVMSPSEGRFCLVW